MTENHCARHLSFVIGHNPRRRSRDAPRSAYWLTGPAGAVRPRKAPVAGKVSGTGWNQFPARTAFGLWLRNAAVGSVRAGPAAAAAVSFTAPVPGWSTQLATLPVVSRPRGSDSGHRRPGLRLPGYRPGFCTAAGRSRARGAQPNLAFGRRQRVHETRSPGGFPGWRNLAIWGIAGPIRLRPGQTTPLIRRVVRVRPPAASRRTRPPRLAVLGGLAGGCCAWLLAPGFHPGRVPRLGAGRMPGSPPGPPRPGTGAGAPPPDPRKATKTARFLALAAERPRVSRLHPARRRRRDQAPTSGPPHRPAPPGHRPAPALPAKSRPGPRGKRKPPD